MMKVTKIGNGMFTSFEIAAGEWFTCTRSACGRTEYSAGRYYLKRANRCPACEQGLFLSELFIETYLDWLIKNEPTLKRMIADYRGYLDALRARRSVLSVSDNVKR